MLELRPQRPLRPAFCGGDPRQIEKNRPVGQITTGHERIDAVQYHRAPHADDHLFAIGVEPASGESAARRQAAQRIRQPRRNSAQVHGAVAASLRPRLGSDGARFSGTHGGQRDRGDGGAPPAPHHVDVVLRRYQPRPRPGGARHRRRGRAPCLASGRHGRAHRGARRHRRDAARVVGEGRGDGRGSGRTGRDLGAGSQGE